MTDSSAPGSIAALMAHREATDAALASGFVVEDIEVPTEGEVESASESETSPEAPEISETTDDEGQGSDDIGNLSDEALEAALASIVNRPLPRPRVDPDEVEEDSTTEAGRRGPRKATTETVADQFEDAVRYGGDRPRSIREAARRRANRPVRFE